MYVILPNACILNNRRIIGQNLISILPLGLPDCTQQKKWFNYTYLRNATVYQLFYFSFSLQSEENNDKKTLEQLSTKFDPIMDFPESSRGKLCIRIVLIIKTLFKVI